MKFTGFRVYVRPECWMLWPLWSGIGDRWCQVKRLLIGPLVIEWQWYKVEAS